MPAVIKAWNNEVTLMIGIQPSNAIKRVTLVGGSAAGEKERTPPNVVVKQLYQPGESVEGRRRAADHVWSL